MSEIILGIINVHRKIHGIVNAKCNNAGKRQSMLKKYSESSMQGTRMLGNDKVSSMQGARMPGNRDHAVYYPNGFAVCISLDTLLKKGVSWFIVMIMI